MKFKLGVTTWSLHQPTLLGALRAARDLGFGHVQLGLGGLGVNDEAMAKDVLAWTRKNKIAIASTCVGFPGEDYSTLESIERTGGYGWREKFEERYLLTLRAAAWTKFFGVKLITTHVGFIPEDTKSHEFNVFVMRVRKVADALRKLRLVLGMESGQETAKTLKSFLRILKRPNVKVNFDPANMILYGKQEPMQAIQLLYRDVAQVHMKDALWTKHRGTWGREVPLGEGEARIPKLIELLKRRRFRGPLIIEREGGEDRIGDIKRAKAWIEKCLS